jgi:hypothetical protein
MRYRIQIAQQSVEVPIYTSVPTGGAQDRARDVAQVKVDKADARNWQIVLAPFVFRETVPGSIVEVTSGNPFKPAARITFGVDGFKQVAVIDWPSNGGMASVWGSEVSVEFVIPNQWITSTAPAAVIVGGAIMPGAAPSTTRRPRTAYSGLIAPGVFSAAIPVPAFARGLKWNEIVHLGAGNPAPVPIQVFGCMDAGLTVLTFGTPSGMTSSPIAQPSEGLDLPPDTRFITIKNNSATDSIGLVLEFLCDVG